MPVEPCFLSVGCNFNTPEVVEGEAARTFGAVPVAGAASVFFGVADLQQPRVSGQSRPETQAQKKQGRVVVAPVSFGAYHRQE